MKAMRTFLQRHLPGRKAEPVQSSIIGQCDAALAIPLQRRTPSGSASVSERAAMLRITCPDPTAEDKLRDMHLLSAQKLVRQEKWKELSKLIRKADDARALTPGSMSVAELMAYGARADVVLAVEHALIDGKPARDAPLLEGIEALEHVLADHPNDYIIAAIVAQSHIDIGWAWRGNGWDTEVPTRNRDAFEAHFDRASDILAPYCASEMRSPLLASTYCALLGGSDHVAGRVADKYEALIDLNPANPRAMRAMGNHLLPRWFGSYEALELEARRTASRTQDTWGAGGYTWVMFDAIACDDKACANLDVPFFVEGLRDILARRCDPYTTNLLAAYCANSIGQAFSGNDEADQNRAEIAACARWIIREHLTELHPMIWAHAARGFDNNLRVRSPNRFAASGRDDAMRIITTLFQREISAGNRIVFTDHGPVAQAG
ncbi:hypothetical protein SAMN04488523_10918 [Sulfitobacter brevis]|uniref:DUF4034 domain-containing protein n=1 Tax=Sulfitobacter brevis TaxID=74348 RepID=A0A1I2C9M8_9RHOB|nr:hypothetical protein [Sulfitobacter brevis]SFE64370.1 hypothetical protein SAMN04488523_10918 [Sulfitobacter brevis]